MLSFKLNSGVDMSADNEKFTGGIDTLGTVEEATDGYQAVGRWWAKAILQSEFNNGGDNQASLMAEMMATIISVNGRSRIEERIGGFAEALAHLTREGQINRVHVDYHPDRILMEAAALADMPVSDMTTFPWKSHTCIKSDTVVASMGYGQPATQVWPPVSEQ